MHAQEEEEERLLCTSSTYLPSGTEPRFRTPLADAEIVEETSERTLRAESSEMSGYRLSLAIDAKTSIETHRVWTRY